MFLLKTKVWLPVGWSPSVVFEFQHDSIECIPVWLIQIKCSRDESLILNSDGLHSYLRGIALWEPRFSSVIILGFLCRLPSVKKSIPAGDQFRLLCVCIYELIKLHPALSSRYLWEVQASFVFMTWGLITTSWSSNNQAQCLAFHTLSRRP